MCPNLMGNLPDFTMSDQDELLNVTFHFKRKETNVHQASDYIRSTYMSKINITLCIMFSKF